MAYLRTEWGVRWTDGEVREFGVHDFIAREFAENWSALYPTDPCEVVQHQVSDWGPDE